MPEVEAFETELGELRKVRRFIRQVCAGLSEEGLGRLQAIIGEAFTNIVSHGETKEVVFISLVLEGNLVVIEVWDQGHPFDPEEAILPDLSQGQERGMGLVILRELADEMAYLPKEGTTGWNRLQLFVGIGDGDTP